MNPKDRLNQMRDEMVRQEIERRRQLQAEMESKSAQLTNLMFGQQPGSRPAEPATHTDPIQLAKNLDALADENGRVAVGDAVDAAIGNTPAGPGDGGARPSPEPPEPTGATDGIHRRIAEADKTGDTDAHIEANGELLNHLFNNKGR